METLGYTQFRDAETVITILKNGNRSTLLHELGHVFLNSRRALALMEGVDEGVKADWATLEKWLDIEDIDFALLMTPKKERENWTAEQWAKYKVEDKRWRSAHEKFAAGFEKYLMEGTAPSVGLARAFRAFRKWMVGIYRAVKNVLYVDADGNAQSFEISDDVRAVMDRMLASEEEIEQAGKLRELGAARKKLLEAGLPDDVVQRYSDTIDRAIDASKSALLKMLDSETSAEYRQRLKELREQTKTQVEAEMRQVPRYKTALLMKEKGISLSLKDLTDRYGLAVTEELPRGTVKARDGLGLEEAASLLGYPAGEALLEDLKAVKRMSFSDAVKQATDERMRQQESALFDPDAKQAAIDKALHVDEQLAEILARREMILEKAGRNFRDERTRRLEGAATLQAVKEQARTIIEGLSLRDVRNYRRWLRAEQRNRQNAARALERAEAAFKGEEKGKAAAALNDARKYLELEALNHALVQEGMRAQDDIEAGERYAKRMWKNRKRLKARLGEENWAQFRGLMERFGFWRVEDAEKSEAKAPLSEWAAKMELGGTTLPELVMQEGVKFASYKEMTQGQFADVLQAARIIEHVGRNERTLLSEQEHKDFAEAVGQLVESVAAVYGTAGPQSIDPNEKGAGVLTQGLATLERAETIARRADGMKEQGVAWNLLIRPVNEANDREILMRKEAAVRIAAIFKKYFPDLKAAREFLTKKFDTGLIDPGKGKRLYWTGENLLAAMLNWGNQHNRERLVFGNGFVENALQGYNFRPADDAQYYAAYQAGASVVEAIFNRNATGEMWAFCQDVWDFIDGYWPEIKALEERMTGVAPEKVAASPVRTKDGSVLRGGYYPVKFDTNKDWKAFQWGQKEDARALYENNWQAARTRHGHTKERVERVAPRAVSLKLNVLSEHLGNVIHDLAYRPVIRDLNKLIDNDQVRGALTHAVGKEVFKQLQPWVQALAAPEGVMDGGERFMGRLIGHVMTSALGFNIPTRFMQLGNFARAGYKLGYGNIIAAVGNALSGRILWDREFREGAFRLSPELEDRLRADQRDLGKVLGVYLDGKWTRTMSNVQAAAMFGLNWADAIVGVPIWHVAYDKGMKLFNDQKKAIAYADQMTRLTNNTTQRKDAAAVLRGGAFKKLFTMFYNAANTSYNLYKEERTRARLGGAVDRVRFIGFLFAVFTVGSMITSVVKRRAPWNDDDWDDEDKAGTPRRRGRLRKALRAVTGFWKKWALFSPTRVIKYNLRNLTGDLDAVIAGNPRSLAYTKQAAAELWNVFFRGKEASERLKEFQERGGSLSGDFRQIYLDFAKDKEFQRATKELGNMDEAAWRNPPKALLRGVNYAWTGIQKLTEYREQILRYATYLSYYDQMKADQARGGEGRPDNWGASLRDEVMALEDIEDRAYKMANELLGAYDQVSELGQELRDIAVPFYSWLEVNARRYWRLMKNGLEGDNRRDFVLRFLKGQGLKAPLHLYGLARAYVMANALTMAIAAFNHAAAPDEEDDLPPDVQARPHITMPWRGSKGEVLYFDRIGSLLDILDWVGQDQGLTADNLFLPFVGDIKELMNGQQTVKGLLKKTGGAAFSKAVNALNPLLKLPFELGTGRTLYPDALHPRTIRDVWDYLALSVGLTREARAFRGEPGPEYFTWERGRDLFLYSTDPEEGAYFHILDRVRQFQENELGKTFDGAATTRRGEALRKMKTALRYGDKANLRRYLREYYRLGGTDRGLKSSLDRMGPLAGLSKEEQRQFLRWLPREERKYLNRAERYFQGLKGSLGRLGR